MNRNTTSKKEEQINYSMASILFFIFIFSMTRYVMDKKDKVASWVNYSVQRIRANRNCLYFFAGQTGSGKSYSCLSFAEMIYEHLGKGTFPIKNIVFSPQEFMDRISSGELVKYDVIIFEEVGVNFSSKNWQSVINKMLSFCFQTFRSMNLIVLLNAPYSDFADVSLRKLMHAEIKTISIDKKAKKCIVKPQLIQYNARLRKFYYKNLRVKTKRGNIPIVHWGIPKPSVELIKEYEAKKAEFNQKLQKEIYESITEASGGKKNKKELSPVQKKVLGYLEQGMNKIQIGKITETHPKSVQSAMVCLKNKGFDFKGHYDKNGNIEKYTIVYPEYYQKQNKEGETRE